MRIGMTVGWFYAALRGMAVIALAGLAGPAAANNIQVSNVGLKGQDVAAQTVKVTFNVAWDNSWRGGENWDAAWVFVKFRVLGSNNWEHAKLSTVSANHTASNGTIDVGSDGANGMGVFVYRAAGYTGSVNYTATKLQWNYGSNGYAFAKGTQVELSVHALEMVYIPAGAFYLGSGGNEGGAFYQYPTITTPYRVTNETEITVGTTSGNLYYAIGGSYGDGFGPISNVFPKGYAAFYCMKYEISQGQYADFLNKLTYSQATNRFPNQYGNYRHTISRNATNYYSAGRPDRACNYLSWADGIAYADWAALRPMTELEFEKACRGPAYPVPNEYAWGTNTIMGTSWNLSGAEDGTETVIESAALGGCNYHGAMVHIGGDSGAGPLRVGIFATNNATRISSGAGYYGVMDLSGNLVERTVTVGNGAGRSFQGTHGDGFLDASGNVTNNADWPAWNTASGAGERCGEYREWNPAAAYIYVRVSLRDRAASVVTSRNNYDGWRAVRAAP